MKYLVLIITAILLTACCSKTYVQRPVVVEKQVSPSPVIVEHERVIER